MVKDSTSNYGVCYNEINYKELELEQRFGDVALKVVAKAVTKDENGNEVVLNDGVTVTPNREQIVWNDDTKAYLLQITKTVTDEATGIVNSQLATEKDFLKWLHKCSETLSSPRYGSVLYELGQMIDKSGIKPTFAPDPTIKFAAPNTMLWGLNVRVISTHVGWGRKGRTTEVDRKELQSWSDLPGRKLYFQQENTSVVKDRYLLSLPESSEGFLTIKVEDADKMLDDLLERAKSNTTTTPASLKLIEDDFWKRIKVRDAILNHIKASTEILDYDSLVVPEDFHKAFQITEEYITQGLAMSREENRKLNNLIIYHTFKPNKQGYEFELVLDPFEIREGDVENISDNIFYGTDEDRPKLEAAARMCGFRQKDWHNGKIAICKISKKLVKSFSKHGEHISKFFFDMTDEGEVITTPEVTKYVTGWLLHEKFNRTLDFLSGFQAVRKDLADLYHYLSTYVQSHYASSLRLQNGVAEQKELIELYQKLVKFQLFIAENADNQVEIAEKSKEIFGVNTVTKCSLIDTTELERLELLLEYCSEIHHLLNMIPYFTGNGYNTKGLSLEAIRLIEQLLKLKNLDVFEIPEELKLVPATPAVVPSEEEEEDEDED